MRPIVLWRDWVAANAIAELVGLGIAGAVLMLVVRAGVVPPAGEALVMTAAFLIVGAYEGAVVGAAQFLVLRRVLPELRARDWIGATILGAIVAWILGSAAGALATRGGASVAEPEQATMLMVTATSGALLGLILGAAQWLVLRRHLRHARSWLLANALAWAIGMPLVFVAASSPIVTIVIVTIAIAGTLVGAVEGFFLLRLIPRVA